MTQLYCALSNMGKQKRKPSTTRRRRIESKTLLKKDYERVQVLSLYRTLSVLPNLLVYSSCPTANITVPLAMLLCLKVRGLKSHFAEGESVVILILPGDVYITRHWCVYQPVRVVFD